MLSISKPGTNLNLCQKIAENDVVALSKLRKGDALDCSKKQQTRNCLLQMFLVFRKCFLVIRICCWQICKFIISGKIKCAQLLKYLMKSLLATQLKSHCVGLLKSWAKSRSGLNMPSFSFGEQRIMFDYGCEA